MKKTALSSEKAGEFYAVHKERPFYADLVDYMSSGPIVAAILEKDNAVADFRSVLLVQLIHLKLLKVLFVVNLPKAKLKTLFMALTKMKML